MSDRPEPPVAQKVVATVIGSVIGFLLVFPVPGIDRSAILVDVAVVLASVIVSAAVISVVHEAGHAVVGRLVGCDVFGVTIGTGRLLVTGSIGSTRVDVRLVPTGGVTLMNFTGRRWRDAAMIVAGLAVQVAVIVAALLWSPQQHWVDVFRWTLIGVCVVTLLDNLRPQHYDAGVVIGQPSDGAHLLRLLRDPEQWLPDAEQRRVSRAQASVAQALLSGDAKDALRMARDLHAQHPDDRHLEQALGTLLMIAGRWREAFDVLAPLARDDADHQLLNNAAWAAVMTFDPSLFDVADQLSERALSARPNEPACQSTRGSALVLVDRPAEGLDVLGRALSNRLSPQQKASVLAFAALAERRLGRVDVAQSHLAESSRLHPACPALPPIRQRVTFAPPDPGARVG